MRKKSITKRAKRLMLAALAVMSLSVGMVPDVAVGASQVKKNIMIDQTLRSDARSLGELHEALMEQEVFAITSTIHVGRNEEGVQVGVNRSGDLQINIINREILDQLLNLDEVGEEGDVLGLSLVIFQEEVDAFLGLEHGEQMSSRTRGLFSDLYVKKVGAATNGTGSIIRQSSYQGKANAVMSINEMRAIEVGATGGFKIKDLALELGITYKSEYSVSDSYEIAVPAGKTYKITARDYLTKQKYEVWKKPLIGKESLQASGSYNRPVGVSFTWASV